MVTPLIPEAKEGSVVRERMAHLLNRPCRLRIRWTDEQQNTSGFETLTAVIRDVAPIGRDYFFFCSILGPPEQQTVIKAAAVLQITEIHG